MSTAKRDAIRAECERRHITILDHGCAFRLIGVGVDLLVADLGVLNPVDLVPQSMNPSGGNIHEIN